MSANPWICGTGSWRGPLPGDPDNVIYLNAVGAPGGVQIAWSYPATNSFAISYFRVYRGTISDFDKAVQLVIVSGNSYFDKIPDSDTKEYFYWIQMVTTHGTVMDPIGPSSAKALSSTAEMMEYLTGLIDEGYLAQSLKARIDLIEALQRDLSQEVLDRIYDNGTLASALNAVQVETDKALTYILDEIAQRQDADEALITSINALAVGMNQNASAIINEQFTRVTADEALSKEVEILYSKASENESAILEEKTTRVTQAATMASDYQALVAKNASDASAALETVKQTLINADGALSNQITSLTAQQAATEAGLQTESTVRANGDIALATQLQTAQTTLNGNIASVQTSMESKINTVDGKVADIGALYTAKVDVNGLVGGFGVYNDGRVVEAGFDVDRFWVGRTTNKVKPFIIDKGTVYIDNARIRAGDITTAKIGDAQIDTLKVAGHNITTTGYGEWGSGQPIYAISNPTPQWISGGVWLNFTQAPQSVILLISVMASNPNSATNVAIWINRDGGWFGSREFSTPSGFTTSHHTTYIDSPGAGAHYYQVGLGNGWRGGGPWSPAFVSLTILATLR